MLAPATRPEGARLMTKTDLSEVVALRKQVADLKESAAVRRRVEVAIRASEELARATLADCPVPLCRLDESGKLLVANEALAKLLGYESRHDFQELVSILGLFVDPGQFARIREAACGHTGDCDLITGFRLKGGGVHQAASRIRRGESPPSYTIVVWEPRFGGID